MTRKATAEQITIKHECPDCGGTGLYIGMAERDGAAVVCSRCGGEGWQESTFRKFTKRKPLKRVIRVFQTNPGIVIGNGDACKLEDFGGMPLADWLDGKRFKRGSEMRAFSCPKWWTQCTGGRMPQWEECDSNLGRSFTKCEYFPTREKCWKRFDREQKP